MLSKEIKKILTKAKVKNSVTTYYGNVNVTLKSTCSQELVDLIKSLSTLEAHGEAMDDTRYYTGQAINISYAFEPSAATVGKVKEILGSFAIPRNHQDTMSITNHIIKAIKAIGPEGMAYLDRADIRSVLKEYWLLNAETV